MENYSTLIDVIRYIMLPGQIDKMTIKEANKISDVCSHIFYKYHATENMHTETDIKECITKSKSKQNDEIYEMTFTMHDCKNKEFLRFRLHKPYGFSKSFELDILKKIDS